jgi:transposase
MKNDLTKLSKAELIDMIQSQTRQIDEKDIQISLLKKYIFAKKSKKWTPEDKTQGRLFNEIESSASSDNSEGTVPTPTIDKPVRKTGKKPLDASLPREKEVYDVDEDKKLCPCCHKPRPLINENEGGEKFVFYPARIVVRKRNTKSYGACTCSGFQENEDLPQVITAKAPEEFMPGSIATPSLVAHIITNKFCDGLPFDRQQKIFSRIGVRISKQNMSNWSIKASLKCSDVIEYMRQVIMKGFLINIDETLVQVLHEENREAGSKSYMWVRRGRLAGG